MSSKTDRKEAGEREREREREREKNFAQTFGFVLFILQRFLVRLNLPYQ